MRTKPKHIKGKEIIQCPECKHYWYKSIKFSSPEMICYECGNRFLPRQKVKEGKEKK